MTLCEKYATSTLLLLKQEYGIKEEEDAFVVMHRYASENDFISIYNLDIAVRNDIAGVLMKKYPEGKIPKEEIETFRTTAFPEEILEKYFKGEKTTMHKEEKIALLLSLMYFNIQYVIESDWTIKDSESGKILKNEDVYKKVIVDKRDGSIVYQYLLKDGMTYLTAKIFFDNKGKLDKLELVHKYDFDDCLKDARSLATLGYYEMCDNYLVEFNNEVQHP
jgi:hypothetical protein